MVGRIKTGRGGQSLLAVAEGNAANGVYPSSLKNWWPCDDSTGSRTLREPVSGMRYRSDLPSYNSATGTYENDSEPNTGAWINNDGLLELDPDNGIDTVYSNKLCGEITADGKAASEFVSAGTKPWVFCAYFKPNDTYSSRFHLGINNLAVFHRLVLHNGFNEACVVYGSLSSGTMPTSEVIPSLTTNKITSVYPMANSDEAMHSLVSDGTDLYHYRFGAAATDIGAPMTTDPGNPSTNIHGDFSPSNGIGISGNTKIGGFAYFVFDTLPSDVTTALNWMGLMWGQNKKVIWPRW